MALPGLFPIYPDPLPLKYQVSLAIPMPPNATSEISKSLGITASYPLLIPNVDMLQAFIKGDIGIADKLTKESLFLNFNNPIAQKDPKVLKSFAKNSNFNLPDVEKYKKDGKTKIPKEDVVVPPMDGIGLKGFEKTLLTSIFETQKPYLEIAKLVIGSVVKIEDIIARVMPLAGNPLVTKSLKPIGNNGAGNRPKAMGYKNGEEVKAALAKLQALSKSGTNVKVDKDGKMCVYHPYNILLPQRLAEYWIVHDEIEGLEKQAIIDAAKNVAQDLVIDGVGIIAAKATEGVAAIALYLGVGSILDILESGGEQPTPIDVNAINMNLTYLNNTTTSILGYINEYTSFSNLKTINLNVSGNSIFNNMVLAIHNRQYHYK